MKKALQSPSQQTRKPERAVQTGKAVLPDSGLVELQHLIGNKAVSRLFRDFRPPRENATASPVSDASTDRASTSDNAASPAAQANSAPSFGWFQSVFGQLNATIDFFGKAQRGNMRYASNPPRPGWPYRRELKTLWDNGSYNEFAIQVLKLQMHLLGLSAGDKNADGILGRMTGVAILNNSQPEFLVPELANMGTEIEMDPTDGSSPAATNGAQPEAAAPTSTQPQAAASTPPPSATPDVADSQQGVQPIINPLKDLYKKYAGLNGIRITYYSAFSDSDKRLAALRWKTIRFKFLSKQTKLKKGEQNELKTLQTENTKTSFDDQMNTLQQEREAQPIDKKHPESAIASFRTKNVQRIKAERDLVTAIAEARRQIASLRDPAQRATAYLELNKYTPYHFQMENTDVLYNNADAGGRTCNVTSVSMVLESLGKNPGDYKGAAGGGFDLEHMKTIAQSFSSTITDRGETVDPTTMRMPDFMQLVAIDMSLKGKEATADNIASARFTAADEVLRWNFLVKVLESFGTNADTHYNKYSEILTLFGTMSNAAGNESHHEDDHKAETAARQKQVGDAYAAVVTLLDTPLKKLQELKADASSADVKTAIEQAKTSMDSLVKTNEEDAVKTAEEEEKTIREDNAKKTLNKKQIQEAQTAARLRTIQRQKDKANRGKSYDIIAGYLHTALVSLSNSKLSENKRRDAALGHLQELGIMIPALAGGSSLESMQTALPIDQYKASFVPEVTAALKSGDQVVLNLFNHFVRLESIDDDGFTIDDPGRYDNESLHVSWAKGISDAYFRSYTTVKP